MPYSAKHLSGDPTPTVWSIVAADTECELGSSCYIATLSVLRSCLHPISHGWSGRKVVMPLTLMTRGATSIFLVLPTGTEVQESKG
ncbi:hypothetical protein Nepgr_009283 [Nepenthes gracilis]|uniref:Uncharacterized protein n=1 Tax=Nepenthes gracilis TaxID=150966 RepID=A0AAD3SAC0_NEPGR|nr:hypothetical protein Nepgr_009283 [Nepenthes gracilis]